VKREAQEKTTGKTAGSCGLARGTARLGAPGLGG
jgi:hypothetical protein